MADSAEDKAQRTEPATPKRREEARNKGQVPQSRELQSVAVLGGAVLALVSPLGGRLGETLVRGVQHAFSAAATPPATMGDMQIAMLVNFAPALTALVPIMLLLAVLGGLAQFAMVGPMWSFEVLQPRYDRVDPVQGAKRLLNGDRLFDLLKSLLKLVAVGVVATLVLSGDVAELLNLVRSDLASALRLAGRLSLELAVAVLVLLGLLALLDVAYQRTRYEQRLKMTRRELRDEMRQREGDPLQRSRFRAAHRDLSRSRMIAAVAEADVVIRNPTHFAVALRYDRATMAAPTVVAKGRNKVAERIIAAAREHDVPLVEDPPLARLLVKTAQIGREVPEDLFRAVAEVLAFVYKLQPRRAMDWSSS